LLLLGFLLYNHQRQRNKQLKKENELQDAKSKIKTQEKLNAQRLHISRDLHDNIGAQLTFIISSIDNLKYGFSLEEKLEKKLQSTSSFTNNTIRELRDTTWAMNKDAISLNDLKTRINDFLMNAQASTKDIQFNFDTDKALPTNYTFPSSIGMNIYRIIQEALNNALKYAHANEITVSILKKEEQLLIEIKDNGDGFNLEKIERGNGLVNMQKRAEEINATLNIQSTEQVNTIISLTCPILN